MVLVLDHINGINNDHRLKNLQFVCPNCNSQLSTFSKGDPKQLGECKFCGKAIKKYAKQCLACNHKNDQPCTCGKQISRGAKTCKSCAAKAREAKK